MPSKPADIPAAPEAPANKTERKALAELIAKWQPPLTEPGTERKKSKACSLSDFDPGAKRQDA